MIQLTKENFEEEVLNAKGLVFVKFAAKAGCQPCINFKPQYESASITDTRVKFCEYERPVLKAPLDEIESRYNVNSFPTVLAFEDGILQGKMPNYKFMSERTLAGLILDEQKKLYNQQCYVEDLLLEVDLRKKSNLLPKSEEDSRDKSTEWPGFKGPAPVTFDSQIPEIIDPADGVGCDGCQ